MPELTENEFKRHLNTKFVIDFEDRSVELELVEVRPYRSNNPEETNMERFSAFFTGPQDLLLTQHTYPMRHPEMGLNHIFLVPVKSKDHGARYEAVFNFYVKESEG
jgi:hypothetical protein